MKAKFLFVLPFLMGMIYASAQVKSFPYIENFDGIAVDNTTFGPGAEPFPAPTGIFSNDWINSQADVANQDWYGRSSSTGSSSTGPNADHTSGSGNYIFVEDGWGNNMDVTLISPQIDLTSPTTAEVRYWAHSRSDTGPENTLTLFIIDALNNRTQIDTFQELSPNDEWIERIIDVSAFVGGIVTFEFVVDNSVTSFEHDIAIDDFSVVPPPDIVNVSSTVADGAYGTGEVIYIQVEFAEAVNVTGTPQLTLETGTMDQTIDYVSGSGTTTLTFNYTVQSGDVSTDLNYVDINSLMLNGGDIQRVANPASPINLRLPVLNGPNSLGGNQNIFISPTNTVIVTAGNSYLEDFENGLAGWFSDGTNNSWEFGTPADDVISSANSGTNAWMTNLSGDYNVSENSEVYGPKFDFSSLTTDPSIQMAIWWEAEFSWDGAVLQTSIDDGGSWQNVGALGDPNNWYNDNSISGQPGGQLTGWTGRNGATTASNGWVIAENTLTGLAGQGSVLMRVAFGSDGSAQDDGVAFDDFAVFIPTTPIVTSVTTTAMDAIYSTGDMLTLEINYDQPVNVDTAGGAPTLLLETGATDTAATYTSGSGSSTLVFTYTVQATDKSTDLNYESTSALQLNGGIISARLGAMPSDDTLPALNSANSLAGNAALQINLVAPVAVDDNENTLSTSSIDIMVLDNDSDTDGTLDATTVDLDPSTMGQQTTVTNAGEGTFTVDAMGVVTFTPEVTFFGNTSITYTVDDNDGLTSNAATISVAVTTPPIAGDDFAFANEDEAVNFNITSNDTDADGTIDNSTVDLDPSTAGRQTNFVVGGDGVYVVDNAGNVTFTPSLNRTGMVMTTYTVNDNDGATSNVATITITINAAPVAVDDEERTTPGTATTFNVLSNDSDSDGTLDMASVDLNPGMTGRQASFISGGQGIFAVDGMGNVTFSPDMGFSGVAMASYTVADNGGATSNVANITVTTNAAPVAVDNMAMTNEDTSVTIDLAGNDSDPDGTLDPSTIDLDPATAGQQMTFNAMGQGTFQLDMAGTVTFTPDSGFSGVATGSYTIGDDLGGTSNIAAITVTVNDSPTAVDDMASTEQDMATTFDVVGNDTDSDGTIDAATVDLDPSAMGIQTTFTAMGEGTYTVDMMGMITFTPEMGFTGSSTISYTVQDDNGATSNAADITVNVTPAPLGFPYLQDFEGFAQSTRIAGCRNNIDLDEFWTNLRMDDTDWRAGKGPLGSGTSYGPGVDNTTGLSSGTFLYVEASSCGNNDVAQVLVPEIDLAGVSAPIELSFWYYLQGIAGHQLGVDIRTRTNPTFTNLVPLFTDDTAAWQNLVVDLNSYAGEIIQIRFTGITGNSFRGDVSLDDVEVRPSALPSVVNVTSPDADGLYVIGQTISIEIEFDQIVDVTGTPQLLLETGATDRNADYVSGSGTTTLTFDYTVQRGDLSPDLDYESATALSASGGTILDAFGRDADLTLPVPGAAASLGGNKDIVVQFTVAPVAVDDMAMASTSGTVVMLDVVSNDTDSDGTVDPATVDLDPGTAGIQNTITTPQGTYTVDMMGMVSFTPATGFAGVATTGYTVNDDQGATSNMAEISITVGFPMVVNFPYEEDFENGQGGWGASGTFSSWEFGTPNNTIIDEASSGSNAWVTNLDGNYNIDEVSQVSSPVFDFSGLSTDPEIAMSIWWDLDTGFDGVALQSSIDGGMSWQLVGSLGTGLNWYNDSGIVAGPGGQSQGWTGSGPSGSRGYRVAGNTLTGLAGQSSVQFRVVLASDDVFVVEGFAFDDVRIFIPGVIVVEGNNTPIADGDTTPNPGDDTDFGQLGIGETRTRTFTVMNNGTTDLELNSMNPVSVDGAAEFILVTIPSMTTIAPGSSTTFEVSYTPTAQQEDVATVTVNSLNTIDREFTFDVSGRGIPFVEFTTVTGFGDESVNSAFAEASLSTTSTQTITVDYVVTGTADSPEDLTLATGTLVFNAGDLVMNVILDQIVDDAIVEEDETVILTLSNPINVALGADTQFTYTILDNDATAITIADETAPEDSGAITVTLTLGNAVQGGLTVDVVSMDGSATTADNDYTALSTSVTFAGSAGEVQTVSLVPTADDIYECDEDLTIALSNLVGTMATAVDLSDTATITLTNDDDAFEYNADAYCQDDIDPSPIVSGTVPGGLFTSGLGLVIDPVTGTIDVSDSRVGIYTVTYTNALCGYSETETVEINTVDDATFAYNSSDYCADEIDPIPTISGATGGTFTSTAGLVVDSGNGTIDLSASAAGTYTITYTTAGTCFNASSIDVTINMVDDASFGYAAATYCAGGIDPTPTITGATGGLFTAGAGLVIDAATGTVNLSASNPGLYDVSYTTTGVCSAISMVSIRVTAQDDATFTYNAITYCEDETDPVAIISGATGGTFSSTAGLVIDPVNGVIDLSSSTSGTYTVTYTTTGPCTDSSSFDVTINAVDDAGFSYAASSYCAAGVDPTPVITGNPGGSFTAGAGLVIDASTGTVDLSASTPGLYDVSYTTTGVCSASSTASIRVTAQDDATFTYNATAFCADETDPVAIISGATGGTFTSAAGLVIDPVNGVIDLSASTPGAYTVNYTTAGPCIDSSTFDLVITMVDDASFSYSSGSYCADDTDPVASVSGTMGGLFSSTPGLVVDLATGTIDVSASVPGTYVVTYTTQGICSVSSSVAVVITALDDATFSYPSTTYCASDSDPIASISGITGGIFSSTAGLAFNTSTGAIDLSASVPGTYTVTYTTTGTCASSSSVAITVNAQDDASFSYDAGAYCNNGDDPVPTVTGLAGGTFSSSAGLAIDPSTGLIDVSASTIGVYTVTYATNGQCPDSSTASVTIENFDLNNVSLVDQTFVFDGATKSLSVDNLPPTATVVYSNNDQINAGIYTVTAVVTSGTTSCGSVTLTATLTIERAVQTITFDPLAPRRLSTDPDFQLMATSSSGLPVVYSFTSLTAPPAVDVTPSGFVTLLAEGFTDITASQPGSNNYLPAADVTRELEVFLNGETNIDQITINGEVFNNPSNEIFYLIDCADVGDSVDVAITSNTGATFNPSSMFTIDTSRPGIYRQVITVTAENGRDTEQFNLTIEKQFQFDEIVEQKYDNVLVVNNNPANNGGYEFVAYEWFKNGRFVTDEQFYSEGDLASDTLDPNDRFSVRMTLANGDVLQTCTSTPSLGNTFSFNILVNPIVGRANLDVTADYPKSELDTATYSVFDMTGSLILQTKSSTMVSSIELPNTMPPGVYIVVLNTENHMESLKFIKN
ncbi:MAG: tandem-95 repeat protein [Nonlabens sp.]